MEIYDYHDVPESSSAIAESNDDMFYTRPRFMSLSHAPNNSSVTLNNIEVRPNNSTSTDDDLDFMIDNPDYTETEGIRPLRVYSKLSRGATEEGFPHLSTGEPHYSLFSRKDGSEGPIRRVEYCASPSPAIYAIVNKGDKESPKSTDNHSQSGQSKPSTYFDPQPLSENHLHTPVQPSMHNDDGDEYYSQPNTILGFKGPGQAWK